MRFWLALLVACNSGSPEPARPVATVAPTQNIAVAPPPPQTGAHAAEIVALAVTPDGGAAASADRVGGLRLWPTLDGTREPVVIRGRAARSITIGRDGDGFAIGTLDAAGGVHLVRTTAAGAVREHVTVAGPQPASQIESTSEGLLILWTDQTISLVSSGGAVRATLTPEPGSHVDSLVVRGDRVLALVLEDKELHGRWIVVDHGVRWGDATGKLGGAIERISLSPDGKLLAVSRPRSLHPQLIEVATGKVGMPLCVSKQWPHEDGNDMNAAELLQNGNTPQPIGFLTSGLAACSVFGALTWWNVDGTPGDVSVSGVGVNAGPVAISAAGVVAALGPNLALATPSSSLYLGYGLHDVNAVKVGPAGIVVNGDQHTFVLDGALHELATLEVGRNRSDWTELVPLDERFSVTVSERRLADRRDIQQLAVFDGVARTVHQWMGYELRDQQVSYEPASRLLAANDAGGAMLLAYDPASHTFGAPARIAGGIIASQVFVVDPARAGGVAALQISSTNDGVLVGEIALADVVPGAQLVPRTRYRVPGSLRAVDRLGRIYTHRADDHDDVVVYDHGKPGARLAGVAKLTLRPSQDGALIAAFDPPRLMLLDAAGKPRWDTAHWSGGDVAWTAAGQLVVQFPTAVATVNLATGALDQRRCGLGFGLSDTPQDTGRGTASVCD